MRGRDRAERDRKTEENRKSRKMKRDRHGETRIHKEKWRIQVTSWLINVFPKFGEHRVACRKDIPV